MNFFDENLQNEPVIDYGDYAEIEIMTRREMAETIRWHRRTERQVNGRGAE